MSDDENPIEYAPASEFMLTALDVKAGEPVRPLDRLTLMSPDEWEKFTEELAYYLDNDYQKVTRCAGAGDKGRDVIARYSSGGWDNYQCKHYANKLSVADVVAELGKLVFYTWKGDYTLPRKYFFVTPRGCSPSCIDVFENKSRVKSEIIARWDKICRAGITKKQEIRLEGDLLTYLNGIDFSFVDEMSLQEVINKHQKTPFHSTRFGSYHLKRPVVLKEAPTSVGKNEKVYLEALVKILSQRDKKEYTLEEARDSKNSDMLNRARVHFFSAEYLERFSRDGFPDGCYSSLKDECYEALEGVVLEEHRDGFARFVATTKHAGMIPLDSHPLFKFILHTDRKGICHQLVNDGRIEWIAEG
ncbi:ABC-three component system protein [Pseudomonas frederiksbergensis]|uniref:ABC-three component system protein n=1 Tax=Pseudomonas frederiksbergensis TaxID=104087 RepID=UPI003D1F0B23